MFHLSCSKVFIVPFFFFRKFYRNCYSKVLTNFHFLHLSQTVHWGWLGGGGGLSLKSSKLCRCTLQGGTFEAQHSSCAKRKSELSKDFIRRLLLYDLDFAAHYLILQWCVNFWFISETLQSAIAFEVNGWLSPLWEVCSLPNSNFHYWNIDQLKDHKAI